MAAWHLAQLNIALARAPLNDPLMAGFTADIDRINALAEASPGFIWRFDGAYDQPDNGLAGNPRVLVTMSVWDSVESLRTFVYRSAHREPLSRRSQWFDVLPDVSIVLWWIRAGARPTPAEGLARLEQLRRSGPSVQAFTFKQTFAPPATP